MLLLAYLPALPPAAAAAAVATLADDIAPAPPPPQFGLLFLRPTAPFCDSGRSPPRTASSYLSVCTRWRFGRPRLGGAVDAGGREGEGEGEGGGGVK